MYQAVEKVRKYALLGAVALASVAFSAVSHAGLITLNEMATQTTNGQDFAFNFAGLAPSDGTGGTLVVHASGDYTGAAFESLNVILDGGTYATGAMGGCASNGTNCLGGNASYDFVNLIQAAGNVEFQKTFALGGALLDALLADSMISVFADNDDSVGLFQPPNFVEVTITYNMGGGQVPEPATLALFGLGLVGAGFARRKKKA